jgi:hypothetical protein
LSRDYILVAVLTVMNGTTEFSLISLKSGALSIPLLRRRCTASQRNPRRTFFDGNPKECLVLGATLFRSPPSLPCLRCFVQLATACGAMIRAAVLGLTRVTEWPVVPVVIPLQVAFPPFPIVHCKVAGEVAQMGQGLIHLEPSFIPFVVAKSSWSLKVLVVRAHIH